MILLATAIVAGALVTKSGDEPAGARGSDPAVAPTPAETASSVVQHVAPASVTCHELERPSCAAIVRAALAVLPGDAPPAIAAAAWASLLCDSTIECPPNRLRLAVPLGSVVVSFEDGGPDAWLNVIQVPVAGGPTDDTQAWIVRWDRPPRSSASPMPPGPAAS